MKKAFMTAICFLLAAATVGQDIWKQTVGQAMKEKKKILVYLTDPDCLNCVRMARQTVDNSQLKSLLSQFRILKLPGPEQSSLFRKLVPKWSVPEKALVLPAIAVFTPEGRLIDWVEGHLNERAFAAYLGVVLKGGHSQSLLLGYQAGKRDLKSLFQAGVWYLERGDGQKGLPLIQEVIRRDPKNEKGYGASARLHFGLFYALHRPQRAHLAISAFQELIRLFPNSREAQEARFYLAVAHLALGQDQMAKKWLRETLSRNPPQPIARAADRLLDFLNREPPADLRRGDEPN